MNDLTGKRFGRLNVLKNIGFKHYGKKRVRKVPLFLCQCDCGSVCECSETVLVKGYAKSCGCLKREILNEEKTTHKLSNTKLYRVWSSMKDRCYREECKSYKNYGGRGICVCDEWKNDFKAFHDWAIANGYRDGLTIERKDVNGNYEPGNCCWIPKSEQSKNRRNVHLITYNGVTKTLSDWSRHLKVDRGTIRKYEKKYGSGQVAITKLLEIKESEE